MKCNHTEVHPGVWVCPGCGHKAITSHPPARECRPQSVSPPIARPSARTTKPKAAAQRATCQHRGKLLREQGCKSCQSGTGKPMVEVFACEKHGECTRNNTSIQPRIKACATCQEFVPLAMESRQPFAVVPTQGGTRAYRGINARHPSDYAITAIIPIIEPDPSLAIVLALLRLESERPYILLIDTGSKTETLTWLESFRAADCEIHHVRTHGVSHSSELVSMALDVGVALSRSRFNFFTHSDCFLRKQTALTELRELAGKHIVAGHQITKRPYAGWQFEFGHTLLMVDQDQLHPHGITWSMRHGSRLFGVEDYGDPRLPPNFIDTERGFNEGLKRAAIVGYFTGSEINYQRNTDEWIDHIRSFSGSKIYSPEYQAKALQWLPDAVKEAEERVTQWQSK